MHRTTKNKEILPSLAAQYQISVSPPENCKKILAAFDQPRSHKGIGPRAYAGEKPFLFAFGFPRSLKGAGQRAYTEKKGYRFCKIKKIKKLESK